MVVPPLAAKDPSSSGATSAASSEVAATPTPNSSIRLLRISPLGMGSPGPRSRSPFLKNAQVPKELQSNLNYRPSSNWSPVKTSDGKRYRKKTKAYGGSDSSEPEEQERRIVHARRPTSHVKAKPNPSAIANPNPKPKAKQNQKQNTVEITDVSKKNPDDNNKKRN